MSSSRELVFLILQFLDEEKFKETAHKLEKESGLFFNMRYFEDAVTNGEWEEVEKYLSGFTKVEDNHYSTRTFFELRKQKYLEALDRRDHARAVEILRNDLKVFSPHSEELFKEMTMLLALSDFRENAQLNLYQDTESARAILRVRLRKLIEDNPLFHDKLQFPTLTNSRLRTLINQSCVQPNGARAPASVTNSLMDSLPRVGGPVPFQHAPAITSALVGWMANPSSVPHQAVSLGTTGVTPPINAAVSMLKRPRTTPTNNPGLDYQTADFEHLLNRPGPFGAPEEVNNLPVNIPPVVFPGQSHTDSMHSTDDLPKNVVANLNQGSAVKSMDFHPGKQNLLLGVAFSKHILQLYAYYGGDDLRNHLEIDAHIGSVNDLAFYHLDKQFCVVTCGEDKTIKVWDAATGVRKFQFEGHQAPVYSVCPHLKGNIQFVYSTSGDGKIKAWIYDNMGTIVDYAAPGSSCTTMAYSTDGKRLFCCGTKRDGESYIVEWDESTGAITRTYVGLGKQLAGVVQTVQFDTIKNRFLAAGDEFKIKFWDMDNVNVWTSIDADGGLPAFPCIRFSKEGAMLAVSTNENGIKILANAEGMRLMRFMDNHTGTTSKVPVIGTFFASKSAAGPSMGEDRSSQMAPAIALNSDSWKLQDAKSRISHELDKSKIWKLSEINEQAQLRSLRLPDTLLQVRIIRLIYTSSGTSILALAYNAVHKLWKWVQRETNVPGKASTAVPPQLRLPTSGILMTNDISDTNLQKAVPCFALSMNDSYVLSASGGKISLYNINNFKTVKTFMPPPPAVTFLAFHPRDNNVIAIGMEDSSIQIYDVRRDEVKARLKGHKKRVTGLAFSSVLDVLVSSYADAQIAVYEASRLDFIDQWTAREPSPKITDATYSSDSQSIFTCFQDGSVCIFTAQGLKIKCRISPTAYISSPPSSSKSYLLVIAAHPSEANQFAWGMTDGGVYVLEPLESEGQWGTEPQQDDGAGTSKSGAGDQFSW